jgi:hypothetical protein
MNNELPSCLDEIPPHPGGILQHGAAGILRVPDEDLAVGEGVTADRPCPPCLGTGRVTLGEVS